MSRASSSSANGIGRALRSLRREHERPASPGCARHRPARDRRPAPRPAPRSGRAPAASSATYAPRPRPDDRGLAERGERGVDVAHQDLGRVAAARGADRAAVAGEVERAHRPRPARRRGRHLGGGLLAEAVQQQERPARARRAAGAGRARCARGRRRSEGRRSRQELQDEPGHEPRAARCARSGRRRRAGRSGPAGGRYGCTSSGWVPQPMTSGCIPSTASTGWPSAGSRHIDHSGRHGPKPPIRIIGSSFQRQPSASSRPPTVTR